MDNVVTLPDRDAILKSLAGAWFKVYSELKNAGFSDDQAMQLLHRVIDAEDVENT